MTVKHRLAAMLAAAVVLAAAAPAIAGSGPNVPPDDPIYAFLDRLDCLGLIHSRISCIRPLCREEIARLLLEAWDSADAEGELIPRSLLDEIRRCLKRYGAEVTYVETTDEGEGENYVKPIQALGARYVNSGGAFPPERQAGLRLPEGPAIIAWGSMHGRLLDFLCFNLDAEVLHCPEGPPPGGEETLVRMPHSMVKLTVFNFELCGGFDSVCWGPSGHDSLLVSDNPEPFKLLKVSNPQPVLLPWIFSALGPVKYELFFTRLEGASSRVVPHPYFAGMKINLRPFPWFEFGFSRTFLFDGDTVEKPGTGDLWRIVFGFEDDDRKGRPDVADQRTGVDGRIRVGVPGAGASLYWEAFGESVSNLIPYRWSTRVGMQFCAFVLGIGADLRVEWSRIHRDAYTHEIWRTGNNYKGFPIGHHAGPRSDDVCIELSLVPASFARVFAGVDWELRRKLAAGQADEERFEIRGGASFSPEEIEGFAVSGVLRLARIRNPGRTASASDEEELDFSVEVRYEF